MRACVGCTDIWLGTFDRAFDRTFDETLINHSVEHWIEHGVYQHLALPCNSDVQLIQHDGLALPIVRHDLTIDPLDLPP